MPKAREALALCLLFSFAVQAAGQSETETASELMAPTALTNAINQMREESKALGWTFIPRVTGVTDRTIESLTGEVRPTTLERSFASEITEQANLVVEAYEKALNDGGIEKAVSGCSASMSSWDWRSKGMVTPPKLQQCGDCWAFVTAAQIESAMLVAGWTQEDVSEQHVLDCSDSGSCGGGRRWNALAWSAGKDVAPETGYSTASPGYKGVMQQCDIAATGSYRLLASGWIDTSDVVPSSETLKEALCEYGPISVSIYASPALQNYGGSSSEVFNEQNNTNGTNHAILLVGWDDEKNAWLVKNSWGERWGFDNGYGWVAFGSNNIGKWPVWAKAQAPNFQLPQNVKEQIDELVLKIASQGR